jgi:ABC-type branched-subunit amino acid transport system substrate-binding protein
LVAHALGGAKNKKVSIGMIKNIYGEDLAGTFAAAWKKLGGTIGARVVWEQNLPSYKSQAEELVAPKPDAFAFFDFQDTYLKVATELLKTKKWKPSQSFATDSLAVTNLGASGGATVEGLRGVAPGAPRFGRGAKAFAKLWKSGPAPRYRQPYDTEAFDATVLCYLASVAAGSAEGTRLRNWVRNVSSPPGDKFTWQQLPEAVAALEAGKDIDYQGASGPIDIEPLDTTQPGSPTAGVYDGYRFKDLRLGLYASLSVPPGKPAVQTFPIEFVTPRIPGATAPTPAGASGASGASGATGAKGKSKKNSKGKNAKKKGT